ncbi:phage protein NinX family protein [Pseudomonas sp. LRF_L74]|uniref:phage protein NinX family protein n=1 Tax=Pseudomonas sp. LRF_L74 TaxID=3369422 RepID=UPI003F60D49A
MTQHIEMQTSSLAGSALAYATGLAEGLAMFILPPEYGTGHRLFATIGGRDVRWNPQEDPAQAWPLLIKYGRRIRLHLDFQCNGASYLEAGIRAGYTANDMLTATLRALVAKKFGSFVQVPVELSDSPASDATPHASSNTALVKGSSFTAAVDAAMVEMRNIHPPLRRGECERLIRAALTAFKPQQAEQKPVAYCVFTDTGSIRIWSANSEAVGLKVMAEEGKPVTPLFTAPPTSDTDSLVDALEMIVKQYPNPDISHVDYRVHACRHAEHALAAYKVGGQSHE